ncbi:MAG: hypothetical protein IJ315_08140 [Firmicutes bacterium]|nr:hypothetical protein [Bacillota bacterium]
MLHTQEERILHGWESRRGENVYYAPIKPPMFAGHPCWAQDFSYYIATFVLRVFHNRETEFYEEANRALLRHCQFYIENTHVRDDRDSFYWHIGELCRAVLRYGALGSDESGLIHPEAESSFLEMAHGYCHDISKLTDAQCDNMTSWHIYESENHHIQRISALWQLLFILIRYGKGNEVIADGATVSQHFQAWTDYFHVWLTQRAAHSMFVEIHSKCYSIHTIKNIYPLYDFAPDPELRRKAGDFITLFWALWAEEQIDSIQGGAQTRIYPEQALKTGSEVQNWAWYYAGLGDFLPPQRMEYILLDSSYRLPQLVVDMIQSPEKRGYYVTESRPFGKAASDDHYPHYRPDTNWGHIYRYTYCTPNYIMGTLMCPQLTKPDWCLISSQNRYQGVTFTTPDACLIPLPESDELHNLHSVRPTVAFNAFWSQQCEGTLITQRFLNPNNGPIWWSSAEAAGFHCDIHHVSPMRVWFSEAGGIRDHAVEKDGWYFTYCGDAYAAVKICQGGASWEDDPYMPGQWLRCEVPGAPVIIETADTSRFPSFEEFQAAVCQLAPQWQGSALHYHSLYGHDFIFLTDEDGHSTIDGEYYAKKIPYSFYSPFIQCDWGNALITISFSGQKLVLDIR